MATYKLHLRPFSSHLLVTLIFVALPGFSEIPEEHYLICDDTIRRVPSLKQEFPVENFIEIKLDILETKDALIELESASGQLEEAFEFFLFSNPIQEYKLQFNSFIPGVFPERPPIELLHEQRFQKIPLQFPVSADVLANKNLCVVWNGVAPPEEGVFTLRFNLSQNGKSTPLKVVTLNCVRGLGDPEFFKAVLEHLEVSGRNIFAQPLVYDESDADEPGRLLVFRADQTKMQVLDSYWNPECYTGTDYAPTPARNGISSIYEACERYPEQSVIINGGYFFLRSDESNPKFARGRLIHRGKKIPSSTLRKIDDHNPKACDLKEYFIAQDGDYFGAPFTIREGKVPLLPNPESMIVNIVDKKNTAYLPCDAAYKPITHLINDNELSLLKIFPDPDPRTDSPYTEALGGLAGMETPHFVDKWNGALQSVIGYADIEHRGEPIRLLFVAVLDHNANQFDNFYRDIAASGAIMKNERGMPILYDEKNCPVFGHPGEPIPNVYFLDAQLSVALAYTENDNKIVPRIAKERHRVVHRDNPIGNYLMFEIGNK